MVLGEKTQIMVGKEPPPVHSHFPNVDANVLRVRNTRLFFFFFFVETLRSFRSKDACMRDGSSDVALSPLIAFVGDLHAKSLQSYLTLCSPIDCILRRRQWHPLQYSCLENPMDRGAWWAAVHGVADGQIRLSDFTFTFHFPALEKEMATHSSVLAWRIPGTGEPGGLPSMRSHRVRHD